ncbi:hypothetical protein FQR65_LT03651 [Abscondita terminalis]|nr:hypothetical protein FQR65_LT03651 [Abscondita terminalis]
MNNGAASILVTVNDGVKIITLNRPRKKNAIDLQMYVELTSILRNDAMNDDIVVTIITGNGEYFSSGNDISVRPSTTEELIDFVSYFRNFVDALIDYPKLIIAVVNGPAVGVAVTALALMDVVYASDRATFYTPFVRLGICPEACSSYLLPRIMGRSKASELLLLGNKLTAEEAYCANLVSKVIPHDKIPELIKSLFQYKKFNVESMRTCKKLISESLGRDLHAINEKETITLIKTVSGEDVSEMVRQSKSKDPFCNNYLAKRTLLE